MIIVRRLAKSYPTSIRLALLEMLFQPGLLRQNAIQTAIQACVVDLAFFDVQHIAQGRSRIPALFHRQFAAGRAQPVGLPSLLRLLRRRNISS